MHQQKSYETSAKGYLYIVPTPIGNLEDITIRAINTLKAVDLILAEDTRNTKKLLNHFEIQQPLKSFHEHSDERTRLYFLERLEAGEDLALVSDAGMPGISDPGQLLIKEAIEKEIHVIVLPGANAAICALVGSGLNTDHFYFYGFLPRKNKAIEQAFEELKRQKATMILYESPHRLKQTLWLIEKHLGDRQVAVARELTKRFEEYIRGPVTDVLGWAESTVIKGECCIVIEQGSEEDNNVDQWWLGLTLIEHVDHYINEESFKPKEAIKQVSDDRQMKKRDVYQAYHVEG